MYRKANNQLIPAFITVALALIIGFIIIFAPYLMRSYIPLIMSIVICLIFIWVKTDSKLKRDFLEPPRLIAILYLISFPLFSILYIHFPSLIKGLLKKEYIADLDSTIYSVCLYITISLPLFYLGYVLGYRRSPKEILLKLIPKDKNLDYRRIIFWSLVLTIVGIISLIFMTISIGGLEFIIETMGMRTLWERNTIINYSTRFLIIAPFIMVAINFYCKKPKTTKIFYTLLLVVSGSLLSVTGTRGLAIYSMTLSIIVIYYFTWLHKGKRPRLLKSLPVICIFLIIAIAIIIFMSAIRQAGEITKAVDTEKMIRGFDVISINTWAFKYYLERNDFLYGRSLISPFIYPYFKLFVYGVRGKSLKTVLLQKWQTTPVHLAMDINPHWEFSGKYSSGVTLAGEMYINFWWFGYITFFIAGIFFGKFRKALEIKGFGFWSTIIYVFLIHRFCYIICIKGGLSQSVIPTTIFILQIFLLKFLSTNSIFQRRQNPKKLNV